LELFTALKRHELEGNLDSDALRGVFERLRGDEQQGLWRWIPVTDGLVRAACTRVRTVSQGAFVRAADALHLTCAADNGFDAVYSHDQRMLDAAACFGLEGRDILA
jgi:predicted nucleic acid-binding protein